MKLFATAVTVRCFMVFFLFLLTCDVLGEEKLKSKVLKRSQG